jgi:hypothetical protein
MATHTIHKLRIDEVKLAFSLMTSEKYGFNYDYDVLKKTSFAVFHLRDYFYNIHKSLLEFFGKKMTKIDKIELPPLKTGLKHEDILAVSQYVIVNCVLINDFYKDGIDEILRLIIDPKSNTSFIMTIIQKNNFLIKCLGDALVSKDGYTFDHFNQLAVYVKKDDCKKCKNCNISLDACKI